MSHRSAFSTAVIVLGLAVVAIATPARADEEGPVIAIPTRPGVPIVINGCDASYAVVEGDWGLARPGHGTVTVFGCTPLLPNVVYSQRNSYHPRYGVAPPRGRNEIEPPPDRALPEPAESFSRGWSTSSEMQTVSDRPRPAPPPSDTDNEPEFGAPAGDMPPPGLNERHHSRRFIRGPRHRP